ncbi:MAG: exosome complex exonuclease Rrp41 [Candidatus Micrarchaeota archaeon]
MEKPILIKNGVRLDGRGLTDLRPMKITAGVLRKADGSALMEWGRNKVLAAVYGPREVFPKHLTNLNKALINCKYSMAPFSSLEEHGRSGPNRRAIEIGKVAKHVFENAVLVNQFPKTQIDISIEILQSDGGTRIAGITAAAVALADAGIPMKDLVQGVSIGKVDGEIVVDVDKPEDNYGDSDIPIIVSLRSKEILLFQLDGMLQKEEVSRAIDLAFEAAEKVKALQVQALKEKYVSVENNGA